MQQTTELDTTQEAAPQNGHSDTWQTFDDDSAFLSHILSKKCAEKLIEVPEWSAKVMCRALNAEGRIEVQIQAYDEMTKRTDFRKAFYLVLIHGCYNPTTGNRIFNESHRDILMRQQDGSAVELLAMTILRLSRMLPDDTERAKKN